MKVAAVFFDVGETLIDETRQWGAWADWLGVTRLTFFAALGAVIERGEHHRRVFEVVRPGLDLAREQAARAAAGLEDSAFGELTDARLHAAMLDEGLDVLTGLWTGQPFTYTGTHYQITNAQFLPAPLQSPRIPIWTAAGWPRQRPFERAARWDGVFPFGRNGKLTPNDYQAISDVILAHRGTLEGFDIVCEGRTDGFDRSFDAAQITPYAQAGVTWWLEHATEGRDSLADMQARIQRGPPSR